MRNHYARMYLIHYLTNWYSTIRAQNMIIEHKYTQTWEDGGHKYIFSIFKDKLALFIHNREICMWTLLLKLALSIIRPRTERFAVSRLKLTPD